MRPNALRAKTPEGASIPLLVLLLSSLTQRIIIRMHRVRITWALPTHRLWHSEIILTRTTADKFRVAYLPPKVGRLQRVLGALLQALNSCGLCWAML